MREGVKIVLEEKEQKAPREGEEPPRGSMHTDWNHQLPWLLARYRLVLPSLQIRSNNRVGPNLASIQFKVDIVHASHRCPF